MQVDIDMPRKRDNKLTDKPKLSRIFPALSQNFSAALNPAKLDFSAWLRLSKIAVR